MLKAGIVTTVEIMVFIYSNNYMAHDRAYLRFLLIWVFSVLPTREQFERQVDKTGSTDSTLLITISLTPKQFQQQNLVNRFNTGIVRSLSIRCAVTSAQRFF